MKKEEFLILLLARLIERGVPEDTAKKETEHVRTYLTESGMEELDISLDEMADGIISMLSDPSESKEESEEIVISIAPSNEPEQGSVSDELEAAIAAIDSDSEAPENDTEPAKATEIPIVIEPTPEEQAIEAEVPVSSIEVAAAEDESFTAEEEPIAASIASEESDEIQQPAVESDSNIQQDSAPAIEPVPEADASPLPAAPVHIDDEEDADVEDFYPYDKKRKMKKNESEKKAGNEWIYVAILVITIPLVLGFLAISIALYIGFWIVLALAMIACIAVLVVFVTAGAVVSLVGIVYGVVQLITGQIPVGMFEVGLGIIVGAAVMFVGILVYNFAVRFIPFGMKLLAKLFRAGFRGVRSGYQSLKGAVDNI